MSASTVARMGHQAFRQGRVVAITGLQSQLLAFSIRLGLGAVVHRIAKVLDTRRFVNRHSVAVFKTLKGLKR